MDREWLLDWEVLRINKKQLIFFVGGAASSQTQGTQSSTLDYASVQRENPEMQRRAQCVIDSCTSLGEDNPMISIHDVGAGGVSYALPELVHDSGLGAVFQLRDIAISDANMSPLEVWCNESQEVIYVNADIFIFSFSVM